MATLPPVKNNNSDPSILPSTTTGKKLTLPKSVFITGANGFIGKALTARYRALGVSVRGMDIVGDAAQHIVAAELNNPSAWADAAKGCDVFIHTAAIVSLVAPWAAYQAVSVAGVRTALDVAKKAGAKRFVHFSSIAAMGPNYPDGADETHPLVIGEDYRYGVAKAVSEQVVLAAHAAGEIACTIIRPGDVYGPGSRAWLLEPLKLCQSGLMVLPAEGKGIFTPVYIDDLIDGVVLAAGLKEGSGQIFILSSGESITCQEFFSHHWRWAGRKGSPRVVSTQLALLLTRQIYRANKLLGRHDESGPDAMLMLARRGGFSIDKAKQILGYAPKIGLAEGMVRSENWLREYQYI